MQQESGLDSDEGFLPEMLTPNSISGYWVRILSVSWKWSCKISHWIESLGEDKKSLTTTVLLSPDHSSNKQTSQHVCSTFNKATDSFLFPLEDGMEMRILVRKFTSCLNFGLLEDKFRSRMPSCVPKNDNATSRRSPAKYLMIVSN